MKTKTDYREYLVDLVEEGGFDPMAIVNMVTSWMTSDDIGKMLDANELTERFNDQ
jgi:hypothetical protein